MNLKACSSLSIASPFLLSEETFKFSLCSLLPREAGCRPASIFTGFHPQQTSPNTDLIGPLKRLMTLNLSQLASLDPSRLFHGFSVVGSWAECLPVLICPVESRCPVICLLSHAPSQGLALSALSLSAQRTLMRATNQPICTGMTGEAVLKCGRDKAILGEGSD